MTTHPDGESAPLDWSEVRAHLSESLMFEDEWVFEEDDALWWQSFILPTRIYVSARGQFGDDATDTWIRVTAETSLLRADEEVGSVIAAELNAIYPYGTFFWVDGLVTGMTSMAFNRLSRGELTLFDNAVLGQATVAHIGLEMATKAVNQLSESVWAEFDDLHPGQPSMPTRLQRDDLLGIHWGERDLGENHALEPELAVLKRWESARIRYESLMTGQGWVQGFANESVIYFDDGNGLSVGVGIRPDSRWSQRWGPGLDVVVNVSPALEEAPDFLVVNDGNLRLATEGLSVLGNLVCYESESFSSLAVESYLPTQHLARRGGSDSGLATAVFNAVGHIGSGSRSVVVR